MCPKHEVWSAVGTVMPLIGGETMLSESSEIDRIWSQMHEKEKQDKFTWEKSVLDQEV